MSWIDPAYSPSLPPLISPWDMGVRAEGGAHPALQSTWNLFSPPLSAYSIGRDGITCSSSNLTRIGHSPLRLDADGRCAAGATTHLPAPSFCPTIPRMMAHCAQPDLDHQVQQQHPKHAAVEVSPFPPAITNAAPPIIATPLTTSSSLPDIRLIPAAPELAGTSNVMPTLKSFSTPGSAMSAPISGASAAATSASLPSTSQPPLPHSQSLPSTTAGMHSRHPPQLSHPSQQFHSPHHFVAFPIQSLQPMSLSAMLGTCVATSATAATNICREGRVRSGHVIHGSQPVGYSDGVETADFSCPSYFPTLATFVAPTGVTPQERYDRECKTANRVASWQLSDPASAPLVSVDPQCCAAEHAAADTCGGEACVQAATKGLHEVVHAAGHGEVEGRSTGVTCAHEARLHPSGSLHPNNGCHVEGVVEAPVREQQVANIDKRSTLRSSTNENQSEESGTSRKEGKEQGEEVALPVGRNRIVGSKEDSVTSERGTTTVDVFNQHGKSREGSRHLGKSLYLVKSGEEGLEEGREGTEGRSKSDKSLSTPQHQADASQSNAYWEDGQREMHSNESRQPRGQGGGGNLALALRLLPLQPGDLPFRAIRNKQPVGEDSGVVKQARGGWRQELPAERTDVEEGILTNKALPEPCQVRDHCMRRSGTAKDEGRDRWEGEGEKREDAGHSRRGRASPPELLAVTGTSKLVADYEEGVESFGYKKSKKTGEPSSGGTLLGIRGRTTNKISEHEYSFASPGRDMNLRITSARKVEERGASKLTGDDVPMARVGSVSESSRRVKLFQDGLSIGRAVDLSRLRGYDDLMKLVALKFGVHVDTPHATEFMRGKDDGGSYSHPRGGDKKWLLTYEDVDGDLLIVGDDEWRYVRLHRTVHIPINYVVEMVMLVSLNLKLMYVDCSIKITMHCVSSLVPLAVCFMSK